MKVCLYPPTHGGGLGEQFRQTTAALRAQGVEFAITDNAANGPGASEVAHLFSLPDVYASLPNFLQARRAGQRIVVSPIYWNPTRFYREGLALIEPPGAANEIREALMRAEHALQRFIFCHADVLIPLSTSEANLLTR